MINALVLFATAAIAFGGVPQVAFGIGATAIVVLGLPTQLDILKRYKGQPKTDIVIGILARFALAIGAALISAWVGYELRRVLTAIVQR